MKQKVDDARQQIEDDVLDSEEALESFRLTYLSRNGLFSSLFEEFKALPGPEKKEVGKPLNVLKVFAEQKFAQAKESLEEAKETIRSATDDVTLPVEPSALGSMHPLTLVRHEMTQLFMRMGFTVADGPEIEDDFHNFTALNFPADHPARDMQDTFFVRKGDRAEDRSDDLVLRTHTSPVQIRLMKEQKPPIRAIMPGRVFRNEAVTYKSYFQFSQVEGLVVDTFITMADLIHTLVTFAKMMYGDHIEYRVRSSYFPFTEPSIEMDVRTSSDADWMEILGAGMVDPNVLRAVNVDPDVYSGFAFGMGIDRICMLKYGFSDIRTLYENDLRMLSQFEHIGGVR